MFVNGKHYRTVWMEDTTVKMIDQTLLPFNFSIYEAGTWEESSEAIRAMIVRGAGAIGAVAGFAMAQAFMKSAESNNQEIVHKAKNEIQLTRPTARNLFFAVDRVFNAGKKSPENAVIEAQKLADENVEEAKMIGYFGKDLLFDGCRVGTHCNAGWLGFVDYGSALSPVYVAKSEGKKIFVYADETRPRGQGARLTAWELFQEGIPHAIIPDHAGAYYMSKGMIDIIIAGADRIAVNGDVANKIGTLEKAIVAKEYGIPFYIAAPLSTFDLNCATGKEIIIEHRAEEEVLYQEGIGLNGQLMKVRIANPGSSAFNPAFDVTPAGLITGIITEKGIITPTAMNIKNLFD